MSRVSSEIALTFFNHLPKTVSTDSYLVSFDIENLYSNITHELGLEAINYWLDKHPEDMDKRIKISLREEHSSS